MQQGKLLVVTLFVSWVASEVVMDLNAAKNLKWFHVVVNNILHLDASKQECFIPWHDDGSKRLGLTIYTIYKAAQGETQL